MGYQHSVYIDEQQMRSVLNSLEKIRDKFSDRKCNQVARKAVKPLKVEMKNLAPKYANSKKPKKKWYYYRPKGETKKKALPYKSGTLKRSVAIFSGKRGIFVAPRIGRINRRVAGNQRLDGWYSHFVIGGTPNIKKPNDFVEKARLNKRVTVLNEITVQASKMIKWYN